VQIFLIVPRYSTNRSIKVFDAEPEKPKAFVKTITIGGNAAFYSSKIEIMADRKAYPYQASFFVGLALGKRWQ